MTDQTGKIVGVSSFLIAIITLFVSVRAYVRIHILHSVGWDDGKLPSTLGHSTLYNAYYGNQHLYSSATYVSFMLSKGDSADHNRA